jgi:hypothetical protein
VKKIQGNEKEDFGPWQSKEERREKPTHKSKVGPTHRGDIA